MRGPTLDSSEGRVEAGALVRARYQLANTGGERLAVNALVADCGCRVQPARLATLAPAEVQPVIVLCRALPGCGASVRRIRVLSNDPGAPETVLAVPVSVADSGIAPGALYFGHVAVGESAERRVTLAPSGATAPRSPVDAVTVEVEPGGATGTRSYRVRFSPREPGVVRTMLEVDEATVVPIVGVGYSTLLAFPPEVRLPSQAAADGPVPLTLMYVGSDVAVVPELELPAGLEGELRTVVPGRQFTVALRVARGAPAGEEARAIQVRAGGAGGAALTIPVVDARPAEPTAAGR